MVDVTLVNSVVVVGDLGFCCSCHRCLSTRFGQQGLWITSFGYSQAWLMLLESNIKQEPIFSKRTLFTCFFEAKDKRLISAMAGI